MAEPWIRVHANLADKPVVWRAVKELKVSQNDAMAILVRFWGAMSQHGNDGLVIALTDEQIEAWGGWRGKRGRFAAFIRHFHTDEDGRVNEWDDYHGKLEDRRQKDRDRKRESRDQKRKLRGLSVGRPQDSPKDNPVEVPMEVPADSPADHPADGPAEVPVDRPHFVRTESIPARANDTKRGTTTTRSKDSHRKPRDVISNGAGPHGDPPDTPPAKRPKQHPSDSWLTPIRNAWEAIAGAGTFANQYGQAAKWLDPIWKEGTDPPTIAQRLTFYLEQTDAQYWSIATFAKSFGTWHDRPIVDEFGAYTAYGERITRP